MISGLMNMAQTLLLDLFPTQGSSITAAVSSLQMAFDCLSPLMSISLHRIILFDALWAQP